MVSLFVGNVQEVYYSGFNYLVLGQQVTQEHSCVVRNMSVGVN